MGVNCDVNWIQLAGDVVQSWVPVDMVMNFRVT